MTNILKENVEKYFSSTSSLLYSYLISLPLLLLYEALIYISQPEAGQIVRISVDVWVKTLFSYFGQDVISLTLIAAALIGIVIVYREKDRLSSLRPVYFLMMILESGIYALFLALLISSTLGTLLQIIPTDPVESLSILQQFALSLGAGLYEELFFRVILVSALLFLFNRFFTKNYMALSSAIILAAAIFSWVHFIGDMGDTFTLHSFLFRFLFGLALNGIYIWRGFGMAAWTHALYDLMLLT